MEPITGALLSFVNDAQTTSSTNSGGREDTTNLGYLAIPRGILASLYVEEIMSNENEVWPESPEALRNRNLK